MTFMVGLSLVGALIWGIWLGLPKRYDQSLEEIDRRLSESGAHRKAKRHMTFLNLLQRKTEKGTDRRFRSERHPFRM
jgi:hypothetical protein